MGKGHNPKQSLTFTIADELYVQMKELSDIARSNGIELSLSSIIGLCVHQSFPSIKKRYISFFELAKEETE